MKSVLFLLLIIKIESRQIFIKTPILSFEPCLGTILKSIYIYGSQPMGEENQYSVDIKRNYAAGTIVTMKFDAEAIVTMADRQTDVAIISATPLNNTFTMSYLKESELTGFTVKGLNGIVPYFQSMVINGIEHCHTPIVGYLDRIVKDNRLARQIETSVPDHDCGRRRIVSTELIVNGQSTKPGDWPWHAAIYRLQGASNTYKCGGTLISKLFVLTVAHCVTINDVPVVPDIMSVVLGKYHLIGGDISSEERKVFSVIVHEGYGLPNRSDNDIALLKLMTEAVYTDYVQPACLWSSNSVNQTPTPITGTVAGWGFNEVNNNVLSLELRQASLPLLSDIQCIKRNLLYYGTKLSNGRKFCAGWGNGTSPCNGDSGSGYMVYIPDTSNGVASNTGAWHIRGITSETITYRRTNVCDPTQYVIFTDISKYEDWIRIKTHELSARS